MNWLANRLAEPSTRIGLGILAFAITRVVNTPPQNAGDWIALAAAALGGLAGATTKAPGSPDNPPKP